MTPLVTIYIPTKNRPHLLKRAIRSCLAQNYTNFEIIVIDDNSDAENLSSITEIASSDTRIRLISLDQSVGACGARNKAIALAQGEFITGLDDDDEFTQDRISLFVHQWNLNPDLSFLCSGYRVITKDLKFSYARGSRVITWQHLLAANYVGNQIFTKTSYLQEIGGFDLNMASCQDYDTWLRLAQRNGAGLRIGNLSYNCASGARRTTDFA